MDVSPSLLVGILPVASFCERFPHHARMKEMESMAQVRSISDAHPLAVETPDALQGLLFESVLMRTIHGFVCPHEARLPVDFRIHVVFHCKPGGHQKEYQVAPPSGDRVSVVVGGMHLELERHVL